MERCEVWGVEFEDEESAVAEGLGEVPEGVFEGVGGEDEGVGAGGAVEVGFEGLAGAYWEAEAGGIVGEGGVVVDEADRIDHHVGSPRLLTLEGDGFLGIFEYPKDLLALVATTARELGIELKPGLRTRTGTDGVVPLRAGYPTVSLTSVDRFKQLPHYHLPTDTTEHVQWRQVADAVRLSEAVVRRLSAA